MPSRVIRVSQDVHDELRTRISAIQSEQGVPADFPGEVINAAEHAAQSPRLPDQDLTTLPFVTIDPPTSMDLDQAMHLERAGSGYVVYYAIADTAAFITAGDPIDQECHQRGETLYGADSKIPLHPKVLSEDAASLLPGEVRPAIVWRLTLDAAGDLAETHVSRARVCSRSKLDYESVQASLDAGESTYSLLKEIGQLRQAAEAARGGVSLPMPEQEVTIEGDRWGLAFRQPLPVELWNAQISLLTGMAAAQIMLKAKVGILRTLPPADQRALDRLRHTARALKVRWPGSMSYPEFVRSLDVANPQHAAMVVACTTLLRGAGYVCFNGEIPAQPMHAAIAAPYTHVTAPLRRLVDRYALETCVALCAGEPVPTWVLDAFAKLPETMKASGRRARAYENAIVDLVEAEVLRDSVGETFRGVVLEIDPEDPRRGSIQIGEPAVEATVFDQHRALPIGEEITVRLAKADPDARAVAFEV